MITLLTRLLLLIQFGAALGIAYACLRFGNASVPAAFGSGLGAVLLVRFLITSNNFRLARKYGSPVPPQMGLNALPAGRLLLSEFAATMWSSSWLMPFRAFREHMFDTSKTPPVLLVHGYISNGGYWMPLSRVLARHRISHHAIDVEPVFADIDSYTQALHERIEGICTAARCARLIVVAHSMGGLVLRAYLRAHGAKRIAKVITLGTPHHGTALAGHAGGENALQMTRIGTRTDGRPGEWLQGLADSESSETRALFVSIYSYHDNIVAPQNSSILPGAKNIGLSGIGHVALAFDKKVHDIVIDEIVHTDAPPA